MPRNNERHADIMFIREKFAELAALAFKGYSKAGRGFLFMPRGRNNTFPSYKNTLDLKGSPIAGTCRTMFVPCKAMKKSGANYPENVEDMVDSYDPNWEFVVVIESENGGAWSGYRYVSPVSPADAMAHFESNVAAVAGAR